jgi:hypothetical protein
MRRAASDVAGPERPAAEPGLTPATQLWVTGLSLLTSLLVLIATTVGIATAFGHQHRAFLSLWGETILIQGGGLYGHESVSEAAQAIGLDLVSLLIAIPLLLVATFLAAKGSIRGRLLQAGLLWYFAYTYLIYSFGAAYNRFFLIYVGIFSASSFAFVLSVLSINVDSLPVRFSPRFARRTVAWLMIGTWAIVLLLWLDRILPSIASDRPPPGLESYTTLPVQAVDLALAIPLGILSGVLLLQRRPVAYLLAAVVLVKTTTLGLGVVALVITMAVSGLPVAIPEAAFAAIVTLLGGVAAIHLFSSLAGGSIEGTSGHPGR